MATTEKIVNACLDLGEEIEWEDVTVDAVAERAGISRRTFFNYFSSLTEAVHYPLTVMPIPPPTLILPQRLKTSTSRPVSRLTTRKRSLLRYGLNC